MKQLIDILLRCYNIYRLIYGSVTSFGYSILVPAQGCLLFTFSFMSPRSAVKFSFGRFFAVSHLSRGILSLKIPIYKWDAFPPSYDLIGTFVYRRVMLSAYKMQMLRSLLSLPSHSHLVDPVGFQRRAVTESTTNHHFPSSFRWWRS